ncbi:hypothetical protein GF323_06005 [Candidatus Woesearchaeota archaeon]|nr:hypothetical protein [Candidatus Woesearchaeota archaeon]
MSITKIAEQYIQNRPYIQSSLKKGLINYSSLAREIARAKNLDAGNFDAILIACRRYKEKIAGRGNEKEIVRLLRKSRIETKNRISVFVIGRDAAIANMQLIEKKIRREKGTFRLVESFSVFTVIVSDEYDADVEKTFGGSILKHTASLVEITLKTSEDIETIPGVMSFLYSKLAYAGINVIESMSCWTDTIFLLKEKDLAKAMETLRFG